MSDSVLPRPWDSPGKNTGVGCHFLLQCIKVKVKSFSQVWLFKTPRLLGPWDFPGKSTGVGFHCLLRITKALQGCKNDIMQLCKSDSYKSFQHQTIPTVTPEDKRDYKDERVTHGIRQQAPRTSQAVQGGRRSHLKPLKGKRNPQIQQAHNREELRSCQTGFNSQRA